MTTGFGIDPVKNGSGVITSGTSAADIRQIWGGLYTPGLVSGGDVTTSASQMTYTVSAGVAVVKIATGQHVPIPIPATIAPTTAPSSGTRIDYVYAQQRTPATDGSSEVVVLVGTSVPVRAVKLGQFLVSSTTTNTNAAVRTLGVDYSIPYGGSLGTLFRAESKQNGAFPEANNTTAYFLNGTINLPTDRRLQFTISTCSSSSDGGDGAFGDWLEPNFKPQLDGVTQAEFVWRAIATWERRTFICESIAPVSAGIHTVRVARSVFCRSSARKMVMHPLPNSTVFTVTDLGVAV